MKQYIRKADIILLIVLVVIGLAASAALIFFSFRASARLARVISRMSDIAIAPSLQKEANGRKPYTILGTMKYSSLPSGAFLSMSARSRLFSATSSRMVGAWMTGL